MEENFIEYWIWLQQALGAGSPKPDRLVKEFGSVSEIYKSRSADLINLGFLNEKEIRFLSDKSLEKSKRIVGNCMKYGYDILTPEDMPNRLQNIYAPPCVLYVWGKIPDPSQSLLIAMVGTREVTPYGVEAATKLSVGLAHCGATVVSGMALGVDAASHKGALKGGGKTVAAIGCGIDYDYPAGHKELKRLIAQNGAVVSEYPPGTRPDRKHFPVRNRIIAGLSLGCVVVEAGRRSGALITATLASEMGRDVFAVPGSIFSPVSEGTNRLLRDGVKPVCNVMDILEEYIGICPKNIISRITETTAEDDEPEQMSLENKVSSKSESALKVDSEESGFINSGSENENREELPFSTIEKKPSPKNENTVPQEFVYDNKLNSVSTDRAKVVEKNLIFKNIEEGKKSTDNTVEIVEAKEINIKKGSAVSVPDIRKGLSKRQLLVYNVLTEAPQHVDDIALKANLELRAVLAVLTTLEIEGYVQSFPGRRYVAAR